MEWANRPVFLKCGVMKTFKLGMKLLNDSNTPEEKPEEIQETPESPSAEELPELDATELMLHGNLAAQIRYSMIKGLAEALDEKAQLLIEAESNFEPQEGETFAEIALPEIEAMAQCPD